MRSALIVVMTGCLTLIGTAMAHAASTADGKPLAREVRAACSSEVKAQGLKGKAATDARNACFAKSRPDLASKSACRKDAKAKGLAKADATAFVKACSKGA